MSTKAPHFVEKTQERDMYKITYSLAALAVVLSMTAPLKAEVIADQSRIGLSEMVLHEIDPVAIPLDRRHFAKI